MKIKILVGILVFLILLNLATVGTFVYFQWIHAPRVPAAPPFLGEARQHHHPPRLTPEQREELRELQTIFREKTRNDRAELIRLRHEIFRMLISDHLDSAALQTKLDSISLYRRHVETQAIRMLEQAKTFLNPEQRAVFFRMMENLGGFSPGRRFDRYQKGRYEPPVKQDDEQPPINP